MSKLKTAGSWTLKYVLRGHSEANPKPTWKLKRQWEKLDECAQIAFNKPYDALTDKQKVSLHYDINVGKHKKEEDASKSS
jgi:hypothetical protein